MIKMKDSGIPWIGQIPENWKIKRNKNVMVKKKDICYDYNNQNILSLTINTRIGEKKQSGLWIKAESR